MTLEPTILQTSTAVAHVYAHGAHVTHYQRHGQAALLFLSGKSAFTPGKPIRGGVPIIFPWFGKPEDDALPIHGFARTQEWRIAASDASSITLQLTANEVTRAIWPFEFELSFTVQIEPTLIMSLQVRNLDAKPMQFDDALHTYYAVGDVRQITIDGLQGGEYLDKTKSMTRARQGSPELRITEEIDRVYTNSAATCTIEDPSLRRRLVVQKHNSQTTVIWNPWSERIKTFADMSPDDWQKFMCVETANARDNRITLPPGDTHVMSAVVSVQEF